MSNRTVIVLIVIAAALFAFIYFYDRERLTTDDLAARKDRVFVEFKPELVDALEIRAGGGKVALVREREAAAAGDEGTWRIESPRALAADAAAVREVLSAIDFLIKRRVVVGAGEAGKPQYGLEPPAVTATFAIGGAKTTFRIGTADGAEDTVYVAVEGRPDELYAVERDFRDSLSKGLDDLRDKRLVGDAVDAAVGIEVTRPDGTLALARADAEAPWRIARAGGEMLAAADQVAALLADVGGLRAEEFVADGESPADLKGFGLEAPTHGVAIRLADGKKIGLRLGGACGEGRIHALAEESGTIACVSDDIAASLGKPAARFAETRPLAFADDEVEKITVKRGAASIALTRDEEKGWVAEGHADLAIDPGAVADVLKALRETRGRETIPGAEAVAALGAPAASVELARDSGRGALRLEVFPPADPKAEAGKGQRVRREGEGGVLVLDADLLAALPAALLAYRGRKIENGSPEDVVSLVMTGPAAQELAVEEGVFRLAKPFAADADVMLARAAAELVAEVEVARWAAERAEPAHGLAAPYATIAARFDPKAAGGPGGDGEKAAARTVKLEIGAPAGDDGARYARIAGGDGLVFVLKKEQVDLVVRPLVARDVVAVDPGELAKVEITARGTTITASLDGEDWKVDGGAVDGVRLGRLVAELGGMRALRGEAFGPAVGFEAPALKIELWTAAQAAGGGAPTTVLFGAKVPDPKEDGYTARKAGVEVTVVVPARLVDDLLALVPAPADAPAPPAAPAAQPAAKPAP